MKENEQKPKEVIILQDSVNEIVKKKDVWIVYTKNNKFWICQIDGIKKEENTYILNLAIKR